MVIRLMRRDWLLPRILGSKAANPDWTFAGFFDGYRSLPFGMALVSYLKSRGERPVMRTKVHGLYTNSDRDALCCTRGTLRVIHCSVTLDGKEYFNALGDRSNRWFPDISNATYAVMGKKGDGSTQKPMEGTTLSHWYRTDNPLSLMAHLLRLDPKLPFLPELQEAVFDALTSTSDLYITEHKRLGKKYPGSLARLGKKTRIPHESVKEPLFTMRLAPPKRSGLFIGGQPIDANEFPWKLALTAKLKAAA